MRKYKVEFVRTEKFIVDVFAMDEQEATDKAQKKWVGIIKQGMEHYHEIDNSDEEIGTIYDVTETDDPFDP